MELINQIATLRREVTLLNSQLRNQDCKSSLLFTIPYLQPSCKPYRTRACSTLR